MVIDGKQIAEKIYSELRTRVVDFSCVPVLTIITCNPNFETQKYLALKKKKAGDVGIETRIIELTKESVTADFLMHIQNALGDSDGIIVQLPLPTHIDTKSVLDSIPPSHDVDALGESNAGMLSPVVGAIREILLTHEISPFGKYVTIIGSGRLVGLPAMKWFTEEGAHVSIVTKDTLDIAYYTKNADIVVCGAGSPGLLVPDMIKSGVVILDGGTSEEGGILKGDAHESCKEKASVLTPVPGGIGPITIAILLRNVLDCATK